VPNGRSIRLRKARFAIGFLLVLATAGPGRAEHEGHDTSPTLDQVEAREHFADDPTSRELWRARMYAAMEFAAMASEVYRGDVALFNARDGAIPYWVGKHLNQHLGLGEPALDWRLMAMSPNTGSMDRPETSQYLREQGISEHTLSLGKRLVLLDGSIGGARTLTRARAELPGPRRHELLAHAMMGFNEDHAPHNRLSLLHLWEGPRNGAQLPTFFDVANRWEFGIVFDVNPAEHYAPGADGKLVPQAGAALPEQKAVGRQWKEHLRYWLDQPETRAFYAQRRALWREANAHLKSGDSAALLGWLDQQFDRHEPVVAEALVRDVTAMALTHHRDRYAWDYLSSFAEASETLAGRRGASSIREPLRALLREITAAGPHAKLPGPPDGTLLRNPHTGAVYLTQQGKKWWVPDWDSFNAMGLDQNAVRNTDPRLLDTLPDTHAIDLAALRRLPGERSLLRDPANGAVYLISGGKKWHVPDWNTFHRMRLHQRAIRPAHGHFLAQIPNR
jgi:hypothetical protein